MTCGLSPEQILASLQPPQKSVLAQVHLLHLQSKRSTAQRQRHALLRMHQMVALHEAPCVYST